MRALLASVIVLASGTATADGVYFSQTVGIGNSSEPMIGGRSIRTRASVGARVRWLAVESWVASDTRYHRDDALVLFVGGEPRSGSDLASYGVATRAIAPLHRSPKVLLEGYLRVNGGVATATGEMDGFTGYTFGGGGGLQITGRVRALGFVWAPLFLVNKGPHVTGALFVDGGFDRVMLREGDRSSRTRTFRTMRTIRTIRTTVSQLSLGFSIGSTF